VWGGWKGGQVLLGLLGGVICEKMNRKRVKIRRETGRRRTARQVNDSWRKRDVNRRRLVVRSGGSKLEG